MSSEEFLVKEAKRRAEIFQNLDKYLKKIAAIITNLDSKAEIYLFGSVAENRHVLLSDIDILVVTEMKPGKVLATLWKEGIKDPFEIHVITRDMFGIYKGRAKLVKINPERS